MTASTDRTAKIWDAATGEFIRTLYGHEGRVNSASFDADGARIVTASNDGTAKVWDAETGVDTLTLSGHVDVVTTAAFNPEGTRVVTASGDSTARIWDMLTGAELANLTGHGGGLFLAMFSPDGNRVLTASSDKALKVWDVEEGVNVRTIEGHGSGLYSALFSPDGRRIVSAYGDGTVKVWEALPWDEEDWHDAAKREQLLAMTGKAAPGVSKYEFLVERDDVYAHIRDMLSALEEKEAEDAEDESAGMKTAEGLGLFVLEPSKFNFFPELELRRGDVLFRMNERDTPTRADASAALQAALDALEGDPARPLWLRFEILNYLSRRMAVLHFPGIIREEITLSPAVALGIVDASIVAAENNVERALRQTLADTGLQEDARIIEFAGTEITDFDSWAPALKRAKTSLEAGEWESFDILSVRDKTDQLILITVAVSQGPEAASANP